MIWAEEPTLFHVYGRQFYQEHFFQSPPCSRSLGDGIASRLKKVTIADKPKSENWEVYLIDGIEEELFLKDNVVVWSRGLPRHIMKTYAVDFPVKNAFWYSFSGVSLERCLCIMGTQELDVFMFDGSKLSVTLPFKVSAVHKTEEGLLIERLVDSDEKMASFSEDATDCWTPVIYSLSHPLNEVLPAVRREGSQASFLTSSALSVVFTSENLAILFDSVKRQHRIYHIRKGSPEDGQSASCAFEQSLVKSVQMSALAEKTSQSFAEKKTPSCARSYGSSLCFNETPSGRRTLGSSIALTAGRNSLSKSSFSKWSSSKSKSISRSTATSGVTCTSSQLFSSPSALSGVTSFLNRIRWAPPVAQTPTPLAKGAFLDVASPFVSGQEHALRVAPGTYLAATESPLAPGPTPFTQLLTSSSLLRFQQLKPSSALSTTRSPWLNNNRLNCSVMSEDGSSSTYPVSDALLPDLCLELIWTENDNLFSKVQHEQRKGFSATKCFVTQDFIGQRYICYLITELNELRCVALNENVSGKFLCGKCTVIAAADAIAFKDHRVFLVIDSSNALMMFSGTTKSLSPVLHDESSSVEAGVVSAGDVFGLHDSEAVSLIASAGGSFIAEVVSGEKVRSAIPDLFTCSVVGKCLNAIKSTLPNAVSLSLYCEWYVQRISQNRSRGCSEFLEFSAFILGRMGFPVSELPVFSAMFKPTAVQSSQKKLKSVSEYPTMDWDDIVLSQPDFQTKLCQQPLLCHGVTIDQPSASTSQAAAIIAPSRVVVNIAALFAPYLPLITECLHIVYEEMKLYKGKSKLLSQMASVLSILARALRWSKLYDVYFRDFSSTVCCSEVYVDEGFFSRFPPFPEFLQFTIYQWLNHLLSSAAKESPNAINAWPLIPGVNDRTFSVGTAFAVMSGRLSNPAHINALFKPIGSTDTFKMWQGVKQWLTANGDMKQVPETCFLNLLEKLEMLPGSLASFPCGIAVAILSQLRAQCKAPSLCDMRLSATDTVGSLDLSSETGVMRRGQEVDGMEFLDRDPVLKLRFPNDTRVIEVRRMLDSSQPVKIHLKQAASVNDHDFREQQERLLFSICQRTTALPIGRGIFALRVKKPCVAEPIQIPKLCLTGKSMPRNLAIEFNNIDVSPNFDQWPLFHNGVATGLQFAPDFQSSELIAAWILSNIPSCKEMTPEASGFLYGLGLNGYLSSLPLYSFHDYLARADPFTTVGLLLGLAADKYGTADLQVMKMLSVHLSFLLPPTLIELNLNHFSQTAAIMGVALLHAETGNSRLSAALVQELGKPPTNDAEDCLDRESYALACGLALGFINLGQGNKTLGEGHLSLTDRLLLYIFGGQHKSVLLEAERRVSKTLLNGDSSVHISELSHQIKEGELINIDVTAPGTTLALGLIYLRTGNATVASWLQLPDSLVLFDYVRPDLLLFRTLACSLILWQDIGPSREWIESQIPLVIRKVIVGWPANFDSRFVSSHYIRLSERLNAERKQHEIKVPAREDVDTETVAQVYCNILAGACLAVALKYAGTADKTAFASVMSYCKSFLRDDSPELEYLIEQAGWWYCEMTLNILILSLSLIMAGTGNLEVLRIVRFMRKRVKPNSPTNGQENFYGSHVAVHMALGFLFLGGGRLSLCTTNKAVAALVCSLFSKLPLHTNDNKYHLQALRHLYVLAVEPRLLLPIENQSGDLCYAYVSYQIKTFGNNGYVNTTRLRAPCLLPELHFLDEVQISCERYWQRVFSSKNSSWAELEQVLKNGGILKIERKIGYFSHAEDPKGFKSILPSHNLRQSSGWESVVFTYGWQGIDYWTAIVESLSTKSHALAEDLQDNVSLLRYLVGFGRTDVLPYLIDLRESCSFSTALNNVDSVEQLTLVNTVADVKNALCQETLLLDREFLLTLNHQMTTRLLNGMSSDCLKEYIGKWDGLALPQRELLGAFLTYFNVVSRADFDALKIRDYRNFRTFLEKLLATEMSIKIIIIIHKLLCSR